MKRISAICLAAALLLALTPFSALAEEPDVADVPVVEAAEPQPVRTVEAIAPAAAERTAPRKAALQATPTVTVSSETVAVGSGTQDVAVTLTFTDNPGVAGIYLTLAYDAALTLKEVTKGDAVGSLSFTKPGNLTANPVKLLWDGMDADATSGLLVTLTFTVPLDAAKTYPVTVSYDPGDFYDDEINDVDVALVQGGVTVGGEAPTLTLTVASVDVTGGSGTQDVDVTITLADNPGVAGAYMLLHYDAALTVKDLTPGPALDTLEYTKPTDLTGNPLVLLWDGLDADGSNGVILTMTFTTPLDTAKTYPITLTVEPGAFYDGNMVDVNAAVTDGGVTVTEAPVHTHSWDEGVVTTAATCTTAGVRTYTCSGCGETTTEPIPAAGHDLVQVEAKAATCLDAGWNAYEYCTKCDYTTYAGLPAAGHDLVHVDAQAPTHTSVGWEAYDYCTKCDYTTYVEIPMLTYIPGDLNGDGVVNSKDTTLLRRFVAGGYDVELSLAVADLNHDGVVNSKDTTLLRRFVAGGYDIVLT